MANSPGVECGGELDAVEGRVPFSVRDLRRQRVVVRGRLLARVPAPRDHYKPAAARSPNLNGAVERANRTHTEEFYEVTDAPPELASLQAALADWEVCYNTVRPHQALGYLTPAEWLDQLGHAHADV